MSARRQSSPARYAIALVVAALVHLVALWALDRTSTTDALRFASPTPTRSTGNDDAPIEIQSLVDELARPDQRSPAEQRRAEQKRREEDDPHAKGQVVDLARPILQERPEHARYLAEYDSTVARETKGPAGLAEAGAQAGGTVERPGATRATERGGGGGGGARAASNERGSNRSATRSSGQSGGATHLGPDGDQRLAGSPQRMPSQPGAAPGTSPGSSGNGRPDLRPTDEMLERAIARGAGSPDYLRDVDDGESTALNAKQYKYASFFNRVKRSVATEWHPDVVYIQHDPSGNVYGGKDRVTLVRVHLHPDGTLQGVTLLDSCGVGFLDDEAIAAFRRAAPFPHPPTGLVEPDGLIHFSFGFIFELSGRNDVRIFKYR